MTRRLIPLWAAILTGGFLAGGGCDSDQPAAPSPRAGVIAGVITNGGGFDTQETRVTVSSVGNADPSVDISTTPDSLGRFEFTVPDGRYRLALRTPDAGTIYYSARGISPRWQDRDTLQVRGDVRDVAFACGRVGFTAQFPAELLGRDVHFTLDAIDMMRSEQSGRSLDIDRDVTARMSLVIPGRYRVSIHVGGVGSIYLPATYDTAAADVIEVVAGQETVYSTSIDAVGILAGTIAGSWQTFGFYPPNIYAYRSELVSVASTNTDDSGRFELMILVPASLRLCVYVGGVSQWIGGQDFDSATVYDIVPGQAIRDIEYLESGLECTLLGVGDDGDGRMTVYDETRTLPIGSMTGTRGTVRVANLRPGTVFIELSATDAASLWLPQFFAGQDSLAGADPIMIPGGGQIARVTTTVVTGGRVRGRLLDAAGDPLEYSGRRIELLAAGDSTRVYSDRHVYQEVLGDYQLNQLADGRYRLRAMSGDNPWTWWPGRASWDSAGVITIENHEDTTGVDWRLLD